MPSDQLGQGSLYALEMLQAKGRAFVILRFLGHLASEPANVAT
jgi:hypothetical protein